MGSGHWGGGSALQTVCCWGGRLRNKNLVGGVAEEMTGLPINCPAPQLINNDRPLIEIVFVYSCIEYALSQIIEIVFVYSCIEYA